MASKLSGSTGIQLNLKTNDAHNDLGLSNEPSVPSLAGIPLKYISLVTLAVQNSALTIIMHYSRISTPRDQVYSAATAVLMNELLKGLISFIIAFSRTEVPSVSGTHCTQFTLLLARFRAVGREILSPDCWKLSIPAILYVIQNNLQFVAVSNLDAATFQVSYQMKIMTTAAFSVMLLRKKLSSTQWLALFLLAVGVGVVQIQAGVASGSTQSLHEGMSALKGILAVAAACFTSGLAGVYFELQLKGSQVDLWVRNVQLSLFSLLPALAPIVFSHGLTFDANFTSVYESLFHNFGAWAWATVLIQCLGGLLTALVIKYADNILKGFATSLSIVISFMASMALFNFHMTFVFVAGSAIVLFATWLYNLQPKRAVTILPNTEWLGRWTSSNEKWRNSPIAMPRIPSGPPVHASGLVSSRSSSSLSLSSVTDEEAQLYTR